MLFSKGINFAQRLAVDQLTVLVFSSTACALSRRISSSMISFSSGPPCLPGLCRFQRLTFVVPMRITGISRWNPFINIRATSGQARITKIRQSILCLLYTRNSQGSARSSMCPFLYLMIPSMSSQPTKHSIFTWYPTSSSRMLRPSMSAMFLLVPQSRLVLAYEENMQTMRSIIQSEGGYKRTIDAILSLKDNMSRVTSWWS